MTTKKESQLPGYPLRLLRQRLARRKANLLDPNWGEGERARRFPKWDASMTTAQYITRFQNANQTAKSFDSTVGRLTFTHADRVPPVPQPEEN